ncbi:MAG: hypothetical protein DYH13_07840 [Alphaproteobacteria bacterium PRO2]|jgi:hypothetical protein|nr:hypothetical protein [Alphaproteobacteria bacterium PRO2]
MNVKIEDRNLRFKITEEELNKLMARQFLHLKTPILNKTLVVTINPQGRGDAMEARLALDGNEVYLNLLIPFSKVRDLADMGRSRAGLQQQAGDLSISLQVDLRADSRKALAR